MGHPRNITFVSTLDCHICVICYEVMKDPTSCKECGHTFCRHCIDTYFSSSSTKSCPSCRVTVTGTNPNFFARNTIDSLQIKCVHHCILDGDDNGCNWVGSLKDLQNHQEQCEWETITCPTDGCNFQCKRREMDKHLTSETGILHVQQMELMKSSYETKLKALEKQIHYERNHFRYLNDCRSWIEHKSDLLLSADFKVHQIKIKTDDCYEYVTGLYCCVPGPIGSDLEGTMIPLLIRYDNTTGTPVCRFPKWLSHPNVCPSGRFRESYFEWDFECDTGIKFTLPKFLFIVQKGLCRYNIFSPAQSEEYTIPAIEPPKMIQEEANKHKKESFLLDIYKKESFLLDIYTKKVMFDPEYIDLNHEHIVPKSIVGVDQDLTTSNYSYGIVRPIIH